MGFRSSNISILLGYIHIGYSLYCTVIPSTELHLRTRVVSVCMGCGGRVAQLLQLLRVVSVCMRMGCGHPAAQLLQLLQLLHVVLVECVWDAVTVLPAAQ